MTKSDFSEWKQHPLTKEFFDALSQRREQLIARLIDITVYGDPRDVAETSAAIKVYTEIVNLEGPDGN